MDAILEVARAHRLEVVEDNAHGLFGAYRGRPLGSLGGAHACSSRRIFFRYVTAGRVPSSPRT